MEGGSRKLFWHSIEHQQTIDFFMPPSFVTLTHTVLLEGVRESLVEERSGEGLLK